MESVILKLADASLQKGKLSKLVGNVPLQSFIDVVDVASLEANPRLAKASRVTDDIEDSLDTEREAFQFMSKGVLFAASEVKELERSRYRLTFSDAELEGILDGGHNTLAIGRFILRKTLESEGHDDPIGYVNKLKRWEQLKEAWDLYRDAISTHKATLPAVLIPVEIVFPSDEADGTAYFFDKVLVINAARNNNAELTVETKANKRGYYSELKQALDAELVSDVEWKANDGGRIKVRDLVALSLIPLSRLPYKSLEVVRRNPSVLFSSKGNCLQIYEELMQEDGVVQEVKGGIYEIVDPSVQSAIGLMSDLPKLFDLLYELVPSAYNQNGGKFGKIDHVKGESNGKAKYKTRYYRRPVSFSYGEGYIYPLIYGLSALMKVKDGEVEWITDPDVFLRSNINQVMRSFYSMITGQNFDPAKVGKANGAYNLASDLFLGMYKNKILEEHGLA